MAVVQEAVEHGGDGRAVAEESSPVLNRAVRSYQRASTLVTSNRPVEDWGRLLGDSAAVTAMLDRLLHHGHILKCGPRSWRTKLPAEQIGRASCRERV